MVNRELEAAVRTPCDAGDCVGAANEALRLLRKRFQLARERLLNLGRRQGLLPAKAG